MALVRDTIEEARSHLMGNQRDRRNRLSGAMDASQTGVPLEFDTNHNASAILSIELEDTYVYTPAVGIGTSTVQRGFNGSTAAAHDSGEMVLVNPIFTNWQIFRGMNNTLNDLYGRGLYQLKTAPDLTYNASIASYELPADTREVYSIRLDPPGPVNDWPLVLKEKYDFEPSADTTEFPSGKMLILHQGWTGRKVRVRYKAAFTPFPANTWDTDLSTSGLPSTAYDILALGAAINTVSGREIARTFTERQPDPRRAEEVPVTAALQSYRGLLAQYEARIETELARQNNDNQEQVY